MEAQGKTMNLSRLRDLAQAGKDGSIRPEELKELFESLPSCLDKLDDAVVLLRRMAVRRHGLTLADVDVFFLRHA
jgi:hypothetical protein